MRVVDQRLRGSRAVGGWVAVEERYFNRIFTPIIFRSRKFFSTLDVFSPLEFSSPAGARSKNQRDRGAFKKGGFECGEERGRRGGRQDREGPGIRGDPTRLMAGISIRRRTVELQKVISSATRQMLSAGSTAPRPSNFSPSPSHPCLSSSSSFSSSFFFFFFIISRSILPGTLE